MKLTLEGLISDLEASSMEKTASEIDKTQAAEKVEGVVDTKVVGIEKSASNKSGMDLANEIMEKIASKQVEQNKGEQMNKQASDAGKALATALIEKLAGLGDVSTTDGLTEGVVPNKTQRDLAAQVAEHDAVIQATPGTDGAGNGGTINEIFDAIVADAEAKGVVASGQTPSAPAEGAQNGIQAPNQVPVDDSQEKMAAAVALVNSGIDFDQAVELVKAASNELEFEEDQYIKQAAFNELLDQGVDFELAAALVKSAGEKLKGMVSPAWMEHDIAKQHGKEGPKGFGGNYGAHTGGSTRAGARGVIEGAGGALAGGVAGGLGAGAVAAIRHGRGQLAGKAGKAGAVLGLGAGYVAGASHGIYKSIKNQAKEMHEKYQEKQAAVNMLVENGVDFESAVNLVNDKSQELYGE